MNYLYILHIYIVQFIMYKKLEKLGEGIFGVVYLVRNKQTNQQTSDVKKI